jgi:dihydrofolate synthase/folylpolyglutamate synthase
MSLSRLFDRRTQGIRLGLDVVFEVWRRLGAPAEHTPAIHVVGTNGKGSTSAMIAHALGRRGRRVGLYTSPHLHRAGERVVVDGRAEDDDALEAAVDRILALEADLVLPRPLSFFELLTLAAWVRFAAQGVDLIVAEAGLGGRHDATRICSAVAVAIARIDLDHQAFLGSTLAAIAAEKVAVARPGVPTFCVAQHAEAHAVIEAHAAAIGSPLHEVAPLPRAPTGLFGDHQRHNAALALAAAQVVAPACTAEDLDGVRWPGRFEILRGDAGTVVVDVAHNPAGVAACLAALAEHVGDAGRAAIVVGCVADKDGRQIAALVRGSGHPWAWADLGALGSAGFVDVDAPDTVVGADAIEAWIAARCREGRVVLVCGSHVLVAAVRASRLGLAPAEPSERTVAGGGDRPPPA